MLKEKSVQELDVESLEHDEPSSFAHGEVRCAQCDQEISDTASIFSLDGHSARNAFANPAGYLRVVITFNAARNYVEDLQQTKDFTWFAGYSWKIIYCQQCKSHLGWKYRCNDGRTPNLFYGLLQSSITVDA